MEVVLIDIFTIPIGAHDAFVANARRVQAVVKTLPGFVEGFVYTQHHTEEQEHALLTIAVWESVEAFESARRVVSAQNSLHGSNPQALTTQLGITFTRAVYTRHPY